MADRVPTPNLDFALKRACPIYTRALSQAVDHGVTVEDASLAMLVFSLGALIGAIGSEAADQQLGYFTAELLKAGGGQG